MTKVRLYKELLHDAQKLRELWQQTRLEDFVHLMGQYLQWTEIDFEQLLTFLADQNSQPFCPDVERFSVCWQPSVYLPKQKIIRWVPAFLKPSLPFLEEDISLARQNLLAQFIQPYSEIATLLAQREKIPPSRPALLIFHWSRCGSTLLSGSFMLQPECKVVSESMLASDLLVDTHWALQREEILDLAIRLQGRFRHGEEKLIIKCNAWDLQHWQVWLKVFPLAQVVCLIRKPEDILASHHHVAGRHMVKQTPAIWSDSWRYSSMLEYQIQVIALMASYMAELLIEKKSAVFSYEQLRDCSPMELAKLADIRLNVQQVACWLDHRRFDAKQQGVPFRNTKKTAEQLFAAGQLEMIRQQLDYCYQNLLTQTEV